MDSITIRPNAGGVIPTGTTPSYLTVKNLTYSTASIYRLTNGIETLLLNIAPLGQAFPPEFSIRSGDDLRIRIGNQEYHLDAPDRAQIVITPLNLLVNNQNTQQFATEHGLWDTSWGYGLINVAKSLGLADSGANLGQHGGQNNFAALDLIKAPAAWAAGITGEGVTVAIIDMGVEAHSEFGSRLVAGFDFTDDDRDPAPSLGYTHGTGVASIIGASHAAATSGVDVRGVAPDAKILNMRGDGTLQGDSDSIIWAVDNGAKVCIVPMNGNWALIDENFVQAVQYAYDRNVVVVIIGGNFSIYGSSALALAARTQYAALNYPGQSGPYLTSKSISAIAVGDYVIPEGALSRFSNVPGMAPFPWVVAPSTGFVASSNNGYSYWEDGGTSFAGPYVAGLAALLFQKYPDASAQFIIDKIIEGASPPALPAAPPSPNQPNDAGWSVVYGNPSDAVIAATTAAKILANGGGPEIFGSPDRDTISTGNGDHRVDAGGGHDVVLGGSGRDTLLGDSGNDTLVGGSSDDSLNGGPGDDRLFGGAGDDIIDGGSGYDIATYTGNGEDYEIKILDGVIFVRDQRTSVGNINDNYSPYVISDGLDRLSSVEQLKFHDRDLYIEGEALRTVFRQPLQLTTAGATFISPADAFQDFVNLHTSAPIWIENLSSKDLHITHSYPGQLMTTSALPSNSGGYQAQPIYAGPIIIQSTDGSIFFAFASANQGRLIITDSGNYFLDQPRYQTIRPEGVWDSFLGYGLVDYQKALDVPAAPDLVTGGKDNHAALNAVKAHAAAAAGYTGQGVTVAILGAGIASNSQISPKVSGSYDVGSGSTNAAPTIAIEHDLGVASILVGAKSETSDELVRGVIPDAKLLNVRLSAAGEDGFATAIRWAVTNKAKVILIELSSSDIQYPESFYNAVRYAYDNNAVVVCTSGNNAIYGGASLGLVARDGIALVNGNFNLKSGSAFASSNLAGDTVASWVVGPSTGYVLTSSGAMQFWEDGGTSYAGPYVAGLAALLFEKYPGATAKFVIETITSTAWLPALEEAAAPGRVLYTSEFDTQIASGLGDDKIHSGNGSDTIDGGTGFDEVIYAGSLADFEISLIGDIVHVAARSGAVDQLVNVERLSFNDASILTKSLAENGPPTFASQNQNIYTAEDVATAISFAAADPDADTLTYSVAAAPSRGTTVTSGATIIYTPAKDFSGTDSFVVTVSDGKGGTATQTVNITVTPVNDAPAFAAPAQAIVLTAGAAQTITLSATDVDGDPLTYSVAPPSKGTAAISGNRLTYTSSPAASGSDSFVVTASDGKGGSAAQTINAAIAAASAARAFTIYTKTGWVGSVGGNGAVFGTNGFEDVSVLHGQVSLDGSFSRGADILRLPGKANNFMIGRINASTAFFEAGSAVRISVPMGSAGLGVAFTDGARKLVYSGGYKIGGQSFTADGTQITASADGTVLPTGADPSAQAAVLMNSAGLSGGRTPDITLSGKARILGTNDIDVIKLADAGADLVFDGSFSRGGDIIILTKAAAEYQAARLNASTLVITSDSEKLTIPVGTKGLTLRFADEDRVLVYKNGALHIGEQPFSSATAAPLTPATISLSLDQGNPSDAVTLDGAGKVIFTDDPGQTTNVILVNFGKDDLIQVTGAAARQYNFALSPDDPKDLEITFTDPLSGASNLIVLDNVIAADAFIEDYATAAQAVGFNFMAFG